MPFDPKPPPSPSPAAQIPQQARYTPGGFWRRFVAAIIDGLILGVFGMVITIPLEFAKYGALGGDENAGGKIFIMLTVLSWMVSVLMSLAYHAWFNFHKGGSPGKLVLSLRVVDAETGTYIKYGHTVMRELLGKLVVNSVTLGIGYIIAGLRADKRGLHDLVAGTRVLKLES